MPQNSNIQQKFSKKTHVLLFVFRVLLHNVFYKETNKKPCHYIPNIMQYHMTLSLTNDIRLQIGFSPKYNRIQKAILTKASCHDILHLLGHVIIKSLTHCNSLISHWPSSYNDLLSHLLIGL